MAGGGGARVGGAIPDKDTLLGGAAVLSDVTKSLARKMKSSVQTVIPPPSQQAATGGLTLEESMKKAHEDAELLKSIVLPLEEQIVALKGKLRETDSLLQEYERKQGKSLVEMETVVDWMKGKDVNQLTEKIQQQVVEGERDEGGDVLYQAMLSARVGLLTQELDGAKMERNEVFQLLEEEKKVEAALRANIEKMNTSLIAERANHLEQVTRIRSLLTDQQKEQLAQLVASASQEVEASAVSAREGVEGRKGPVNRVVSEAEWQRLVDRLDAVMVDMGVQHGEGGGRSPECGIEKEVLDRIRVDKEAFDKMKVA